MSVDQNGKMWAVPEGQGFNHNSLVPADQGVLAAGNLKVTGKGTQVEANGGSGHYNAMGPDGGFSSGEAKDFVVGVKGILESSGLKVNGVSAGQFYPGDENPFN